MKGCGCLAVVALIGIAAVVLVVGAMRAPTLAPVETSHNQALAAQTKLTEVTAAVARARQSGQPTPFSETFTDGELSSLVNEHIAVAGVPFDTVILHSNPAGYVEGQAEAHLAGQTFPLYLRANIDVNGGQASLHLVQSKLGFVGVPGPISAQIDAALKQSVNLGNQAPVDHLQVNFGNGMLTISGLADPAG